MTSRSLRALRGAGAAASATLLAAVSHTIGGGGAPDIAVVVVMALLLAPLATAMVGSRPRVWRLAAAVLVSQIGFHTAFAAVSGAPGSALAESPRAATAVAAAVGTHVHSGGSAIGMPGLAFPAASGSALSMLDPVMLAAHIVAAVASFLLLYRGEAATRAIAGFVAEILTLRPPTLRAVLRRPAPHPQPRDVAAPRSAALLRSVRRRGPPPFSIAR